MKTLVLVTLLFSFSSYAAEGKDCIPVGTSLEEIIKSKDFASTESDTILRGISKSTDALYKLRYDNCGASAESTKEYCRSSCVLTKDLALQGTCKRFCAIQNLILKNRECEDKITKMLEIDAEFKSRPEPKSTSDHLKELREERANQ